MDRMFKLPFGALLLLSCALNALAHGGTEHAQVEVPPDADWATRHMAGMNSSRSPHNMKRIETTH
jgi:hypothetical protein